MKSFAKSLMVCLSTVLFLPMATTTEAATSAKKPAAKAAAPKKPAATPAKKPTAKDAAPKKSAPSPAKPEPAPLSPAMQPREGFAGQALSDEIDARVAYLRIFKCAPRIRQAILALASDQPAEFIIEPMSVNANAATNVITIESAGPNGSATRYDVLQINPGCDGLYTQTIYWSKPCDSVKANDFANFVEDRMIMKSVKSYRYGNNLQLSLIKADKGCISIKKEMFL